MAHLITIEGGDFTGKSSVAGPGLQKVLQAAGVPVILSREPGGTERGEEIRNEIFRAISRDPEATAEELAKLFNESRRIHLEEVYMPFHEKHPDGIAIFDRYSDSTVVYQGLIGGVPIPDLLRMHENEADNIYPDLTIILHIPEEKFEETMRLRGESEDPTGKRDKTAFDEVDTEIHLERQRHFHSLQHKYEEHGIDRNFQYVDASRHPHAVIRANVRALSQYMRSQGYEIDLESHVEKLHETEFWKKLDEMWIAQQRMK